MVDKIAGSVFEPRSGPQGEPLKAASPIRCTDGRRTSDWIDRRIMERCQSGRMGLIRNQMPHLESATGSACNEPENP